MLITKEEKPEIVLRHLRNGITLREPAEEYAMYPSGMNTFSTTTTTASFPD